MGENYLHTCIVNPARLEELVLDRTSGTNTRVHSMGFVRGHGYWVLFEEEK